MVLLLTQLSDAAWVQVCTENDRPGLIPQSVLIFVQTASHHQWEQPFLSPVSIGSHFDNTSYNMHLLFLHKYPNKSVSDGSAEKHEDFLFVLPKKLSRMAVGQVALADSHGPCLPAHPTHFSLSLPLPLSFLLPLPLFLFLSFLPFLPFFKTESQCVAQGDLELTILLPQP